MLMSKAAILLAAISIAGCSAAVPTSSVAVPTSAETPEPGACLTLGPAPRFVTVLSTITFNRPARVIAAADLTGDGWDDLVVAEWPPHSDNEADRTELEPMHLMVSQGDGRFVRSPAFSAEARDPHAVAGDFNGDGALDLAIFDAGVYATARSLGYGNPPQLFLSQPDGSMAASSALADAVAAVHSPESSGPGDLHVKNAIAGDIDGDGDLDMWVESAGGANVENHFMVNDGAGGFVLDEHRIDNLVLTRARPGRILAVRRRRSGGLGSRRRLGLGAWAAPRH